MCTHYAVANDLTCVRYWERGGRTWGRGLGTGHYLPGGGGLQNGKGWGGGETSEVLALQKGGRGGKGFSHADGGRGTNNFGVVLTGELKVLVILKGDLKKFPSFNKGGAQKVLPYLEAGGGGRAKGFEPAIF